LHKYDYCAGNPINRSDPSGHDYGDTESQIFSELLEEVGLASPSSIGALIAEQARKSVGSDKWSFGVANGNFGKDDNKCNKFVADTCNSIGRGILVPDTHTTHSGKTYPPTAGEWGNASVNIPGWKVVKDPMPGDVAGQKIHYSDATGHCAIVYRIGKYGPSGGYTIGTSTYINDRIAKSDWGFRPEQSGKVVFRRYIGTGDTQ
jgi:hypothetical protein